MQSSSGPAGGLVVLGTVMPSRVRFLCPHLSNPTHPRYCAPVSGQPEPGRTYYGRGTQAPDTKLGSPRPRQASDRHTAGGSREAPSPVVQVQEAHPPCFQSCYELVRDDQRTRGQLGAFLKLTTALVTLQNTSRLHKHCLRDTCCGEHMELGRGRKIQGERTVSPSHYGGDIYPSIHPSMVHVQRLCHKLGSNWEAGKNRVQSKGLPLSPPPPTLPSKRDLAGERPLGVSRATALLWAGRLPANPSQV